MQQTKISPAQVASLLIMAVLSTSMLSAPNFAFREAGRDMWISAILSPAFGFIILFTVVALHRIFPGRNLIQYSVNILGAPVSKALGLLFLFNALLLNGSQTRQFIDFMSLSYFTRTPSIVFTLSITLVAALAIRSGVEIISRIAGLLAPISIFIVLIIILPLTYSIDLERLMPVMEHGFRPIGRGAMALNLWFSMFVYLTFFLPHVTSNKGMLRWGSISVTTAALCFIFSFIYTLGIMGSALKAFTYPFMVISRYTQAFEFLAHLDSLVMLFWVIDVFLRVCMTYYCVVVGFAHLFGLRDHVPLILPVGVIVTLFTYWSYPNTIVFASSGSLVAVSYTIFNFIYPLILLAAAKLRGFAAQSSN
ncbi:spore germination protein KB [Paenibacillus cellulosilyticus]|uniref:Spore germination protein KB n=1 Tax=Paenibacillus cellulosilyticus TaxID=375489 RepID=A0A2V2Z2B4_9BACL|nr:endospore germination permease [Paenibacillus cellulosilyticus]PWW08416.1 spore germination protein KB [Paenibacillus cellulosilyticus]QKS48004.1 endospore germination permease [Paenibacillus cellulosilyticus]